MPMLLEIRQTGSALRVAAVDEETGLEVVLIAPVTAPRAQIEAAAAAKLARAVQRQASPAKPPRDGVIA